MAKLSQAQIAMYAQSAGLPNPVLMSAIAMAESEGSTTAHNPIGLDDSYGLWQINMRGGMGPERRAKLGISQNSQLYDPAVNARAAAMILKEQGLSAWSTYTDGSYKDHMPKTSGGVVQAGWWDDFRGTLRDGLDWLPVLPGVPGSGLIPGNPSLGDLGGAVGGGTDTLTGIGDVARGIGTVAEATTKTAAWMAQPKNWVRVAYVVGGAVLAGMGLYIMASPLIGKAVAATPGAQALKKTIGSGGGSKAKGTK